MSEGPCGMDTESCLRRAAGKGCEGCANPNIPEIREDPGVDLATFLSGKAAIDPALGPCVWAPGGLARGTYAGGRAHPAKAHPDLAVQLVERYTRPGDVVLDPFAGIGTIPVEAVLRGRRAVGIELEARFHGVLLANLAEAGRSHNWRALHGDSRRLSEYLAEIAWGIDASITSPPYAKMRIGGKGDDGSRNIRMADGSFPRGKEGWERRKAESEGYGDPNDPANLGNLPLAGPDSYWAVVGSIYGQIARLLRPGGHLVVILRDYVRGGEIVPLCAETIKLVGSLGLEFLPCGEASCPGRTPGREFYVPPHSALFRVQPSLWTRHNADRWRKKHPEGGACPYDSRHEAILAFRKGVAVPPPPLSHGERTS